MGHKMQDSEQGLGLGIVWEFSIVKDQKDW